MFLETELSALNTPQLQLTMTYSLSWQKKGKAKPPVQRFHAEFDRLKQQPVLQLRSEGDVAMDGDFAGSSAELCICSKR
jgi:hypothetical protein